MMLQYCIFADTSVGTSDGFCRKFKLVHVDLQNTEAYPAYTALSYTWGDATAVASLNIDGAKFDVSSNLAEALDGVVETAFRTGSYLWVDQICINQLDRAERSVQVRHMTELYEKAAAVCIWLGQSGGDHELALNILSSWKPALNVLTPAGGPLLAVLNQLSSDEATWLYLVSSVSSERHWAAIDNILKRPWWGRAWVIQEATGPVRTYVLCGNATIDFPDLVKSLLVGRLITQMPGYPFQALNTRKAYCMHMMAELRKFKQLQLLDALQFTRSFTCADPRDKVYVVLGLVQNSHVITPDYERSICQVYTDVVQYCVTAYPRLHRLDFLAYVSETSGALSQRRWPSFVPDWRSFSGLSNFKKTTMEYQITHRLYNASLDNEGNLLLEDGKLWVEAFYVDEVSELGLACDDDHSIKETISSWLPPDAKEPYPTGDTYETAFLHTLVGDVYRGSDFSLRRGNCWEPTAFDRKYAQSASVDEFHATHLMRVAMERTVLQRRLFRTQKGFIGIGPANMAISDRIYGFLGGQMLYVVRIPKVSGNDRYQGSLEATFIGECYVHGLMDGKGVRDNADGTVEIQRMALR